MADEMIELMDLSKVAKRSQSERGSTQREHFFLLDHEGLKVCIYQPVMLFAGRPFVFYLHLLSTFFFFFFFFGRTHMHTLNALSHRKGLNVYQIIIVFVCFMEVLSLVFYLQLFIWDRPPAATVNVR